MARARSRSASGFPGLPGWQLLGVIRQPPARSIVYDAYNRLRQAYILEATMRHFRVRDDDPAPLFGKKLLDAGCGEATIAEFLALSGAEIVAVDPKESALKVARVSAEQFGAPVTFIKGKVEDLIAQPDRYDVILALDLLEDTPDPAKTLWVLRQLLAPGGVIVFSVISRSFRAWFLHIFLSGYVYGRTKPGKRSWRAFHTPEQLMEMAKKAGLKLKNVQGLRFSFSRGTWVKSMKPLPRYLATAVAL